MRKFTIVLFITAVVAVIITFFNFVSITAPFSKRVLQSTSDNNTTANTSSDLKKLYDKFQCLSFSLAGQIPEDKINETLQYFQLLFQKDLNLTNFLGDFLTKPEESDPSVILNRIIIILMPVLIVLIVSVLGWLTYCSCCCYDYCPIICRPNANKEYSPVERLIPVLIVVFSGISLIVPSALGYMNFENLMVTFNKLGCTVLETSYLLNTGNYLNLINEVQFSACWMGIENDLNYFKDTQAIFEYEIIKARNAGTLQKVPHLESLINSTVNQLHELYYKYMDFPNRTLIIPNITNRNLSKKEITYFEVELGNTTLGVDDDFLIPVVEMYITNNFEYCIDLIQNFTENLDHLKTNIHKVEKLFNVMHTQFSSLAELNDLLALMIKYLDIVFSVYNSVFVVVKIFLLISQMFVLILNIAVSIIIISSVGGKLKYFGHVSWCLSAFNIVLMASVSLVFYCLGAVLINSGEVIRQVAEAHEQKVNDKYPWMNCFNDYSTDLMYSIYPDNVEMINELNNFSLNLIKLKMMAEKDPFHTLTILDKVKDVMLEISSPSDVIVDRQAQNVSSFEDLVKTLNRMVDYRHSIPYHVMNNCGVPISFELFIDPASCTYIYLTKEQLATSLESAKKGKVCLLLQDLNEQNIQFLFQSSMKCNYTHGKFLEENYTDMYTQFLSGWRIATAYYEQYQYWRNFTGDMLYNMSWLYYNTSQEYFQWIQEFNKEVIEPLNTNLNLKLNEFANKYRSIKDVELANIIHENFTLHYTFMNYTSCSFMHRQAIDIVEIMTMNISTSTYVLLVSYVFLLIYNSLSAIYGLHSTLINFKKDDDPFNLQIIKPKNE